MNTDEVVLKDVGPVRLAELTGTAEGYGPEHIGPVVTPLYTELIRRLEAAGVHPTGPAVAYYEPAGDRVAVHAGMPVTLDPGDRYGFAVVDLPLVPAAATVIHRGSMDDVLHSLQVLAHWIEDNGYRPLGYHREVYLDYDPDKPEAGVTELQIPVVRN